MEYKIRVEFDEAECSVYDLWNEMELIIYIVIKRLLWKI